MSKFKLSEICAVVGGELHGDDVEVENVNTDTRSIKRGELFVALTGEQFDGNNFVAAAQTKGASAAILSKKIDTSLPYILVNDTRLALRQIAKYWREKFTLPVIALTGSCGKTTTKEILRSILSQCGSVLANKGTFNNDIGMPLTLLNLSKEHEYAVIEMGANHKGEIACLTQIAQPTIAFINNIAPAHLEGFGSVEGVAQAKSEIFQGLPEDGVALVNFDDNFASWLIDLLGTRKVITFSSKSDRAMAFAKDIQRKEDGTYTFNLHLPAGETEIHLPLQGEHNVQNALAAATAAYVAGASLNAIKAGIQAAEPVSGRLVVKQSDQGARIFDDTYNANPLSVKAALQVLAGYPGEKMLVLGDMGELGPAAKDFHAEIGEFAKNLGINYLYACGELSQWTVKSFGKGGHHYPSQAELSQAVRAMVQPNMTILIKGSRSAKMENVVAVLVTTNGTAKHAE